MASSQANNDQNQNVGGNVGELEASFGLDDFLNNIGAATSTATSGMSAGNWGNHTANIEMGGSASLSFKQVALFGGLALFAWFIVRKIKGVK